MSKITLEDQTLIHKALQGILPEKTYNIWCKRLEFINTNSEEIEVSSPNPFTNEWVKDHYKTEILAAIHNSIGTSPELKFSVNSSPESQNAPVPASTDYSRKYTPVTPGNSSRKTYLNTNYNLENFIVGKCNKIAFETAKLAVNTPGVFNPVVVYGGSGTGKTHLLHAICNSYMETHPEEKLVYYSAEQFTNEFMFSVASKAKHLFSEKIRKADILVIDDIGYFASGNKDATQEELIHAIDHLLNNEKQIVFSANSPANAIEGLKDRLQKRLIAGLSIPLEKLDIDTKTAVIKSREISRNITLNDNIREFVIAHHSDCIREIDGAIAKLAAFFSLGQIELTDDFVKNILGTPKQENLNTRPDINAISKAVCESFGINLEQLKGRSRSHKIREARTVAMILARDMAGCSFAEIGDYMGKRQHATVLTAIKGGRKLIANDTMLQKRIEMLKKSFDRK